MAHALYVVQRPPFDASRSATKWTAPREGVALVYVGIGPRRSKSDHTCLVDRFLTVTAAAPTMRAMIQGLSGMNPQPKAAGWPFTPIITMSAATSEVRQGSKAPGRSRPSWPSERNVSAWWRPRSRPR